MGYRVNRLSVMRTMALNARKRKFELLHALEAKLNNTTDRQTRENLVKSIETMELMLYRDYGYKGESYYAANPEYAERI